MQVVTFDPCPPFRFDLALRYLARSPEEPLDIVTGDSHRRALLGPRGPALIEVRARNERVDAEVLVGEIDRAWLADYVRHQYRIDDDRTNLPAEEPLAAELLSAFAGLPLVQAASPWEAIVWAIIGQQINVRFAYRVKRAFVEGFGERICCDGRTYYTFPTPERVVELSHDEHLRPIQFSRQKSRYVVALAEAILDGHLDFDAVSSLDDEEASAMLQQHLGVGRWTAEYVLLRAFARRDVLPAADMGLRAALGVHRGLGRNATEQEVREIAGAWRPYRGEIGFMVWFGLQSGWFRKPAKA